jgi:hypothetical protein
MWYIITFILAFIIGWKLREFYAIYTVQKYLNPMVEESTKPMPTFVYIEKHEGGLMVFEESTNKYLTMGKDLAEVDENLKKLYPTKLFVTKTNLEEFT